MTNNSGTMPPPPYQPPSGPPPTPPSDGGGRNKWWFIGGGVALFVVVLGIIAALTGGSDNDLASTSTDSPATLETTQASQTTEAVVETTQAPETTEAVVETTQAPETTEAGVETTQAPETTVLPTSEPGCRYLGVDDFGDMQVEVEFINPLGSVPAVEIAFALLDGSGTRFHTDSRSFDLPQVDERFRAEVDTVTELPPDVDSAAVSCQILDVGEGFGYDDVQLPSESSACEIVEVDGFGDIQIALAVTSPFDSTESLRIYYALRGGGAARFNDSSTFVEFVGPGEAMRVAEDTVTDVPAWATEADISCSILGIRVSEF